MRQLLLLLLLLLVPTIFICSCTTAPHYSPPTSLVYNSDTLSQPAQYSFFDSKGNVFAIVTLILPDPILSESFDGKWCGKPAPSYVRTKTEEEVASDKLNVPILHRLICHHKPDQPATALINLNPDDPEDYIVLFMPISDEPAESIIGRWVYATDGGEVASGTFTGPNK